MIDRDADLARAILQRDVQYIKRSMFEPAQTPVVRSGFRTETELWDFKADCPASGRSSEAAWADLACEVLSFHNHKGGLIIFGIENSLKFCGASRQLDSKMVNDRLRRYLSDTLWVEFHREFIQPSQRYIGIAIIPPKVDRISRFISDAPEVNGKKLFLRDESATRSGDSSLLLSSADADEMLRQLAIPTLGEVYKVDEPSFRVLAPDYERFVYRDVPCRQVEDALRDPRVSIASIIGIGGIGKTALATWATLRAYDRKDFDFIVSITAKDRELTATGIKKLDPALTSFEALLDSIAEVTGFGEFRTLPIVEKELRIRELLECTKGLLFVDNLETVDDGRIIGFLDSLPVGVRAITTSRRTNVRVSVKPIDLGPLDDAEVVEFVTSLLTRTPSRPTRDLSDKDKLALGVACDRIPLVIRWVIARSKSVPEAKASAERLIASGKAADELLEFCFRRIFESMDRKERDILSVLSLFHRPMTREAIYIACARDPQVIDSLESLVADALVQRLFDPDENDYCYTIIPLTRRFVSSEVNRHAGLEEAFRTRLTDWYEARDIPNVEQRLLAQQLRQGRSVDDTALVDLALAAERRGHLDTAESFYQQALVKSPRSWRAQRQFAEFHRHRRRSLSEALRLYEMAAANAPRRGRERGIIHREWGLLLRESGEADAINHAIQAFDVAIAELPNDGITIYALATLLERKGLYGRVVVLVEPRLNNLGSQTKELVLPLLAKAYERTNNILARAALKQTHSI